MKNMRWSWPYRKHRAKYKIKVLNKTKLNMNHDTK